MKPRETGGNVPGAKKRPVKAAPKPSVKAPAAPASYYRTPQRSALSHVTRETRKKPEDSLTPAQIRTAKRYRMVDRNFPYTNPLQVGYANASGDVERNILPRATRSPTAPPKVHPGMKPGASGYAYLGKNAIWLTPSGYMAKPNYTRGVALHEFAHTRQHPKTQWPKWVIEGGADYVAKGLAKRLGLPSYRPGYPKYMKSVERRVRVRVRKRS